MPTVKTKIQSLEMEISILEHELEQLEDQGTYGGPEYDAIAEELGAKDHDLEQLHRLDEDDMC